MRTAVDTSVLLDLLSPDEAAAERSDVALQGAASVGELIVCDLVLAELGPALGGRSVGEFARDWQLRYTPCTLEVAELAARHFAEYLARGGKRGRVVADFLIGAHAKLLADRLLTADSGFRRDYFADLPLIAPQ
jgi:predicted nucleic acid-binding protein